MARRSGRTKKAPERLGAADKTDEEDDNSPEPDHDQDLEEEDLPSPDEDEEDFEAPKPTRAPRTNTQKRARKSTGTTRRKSTKKAANKITDDEAEPTQSSNFKGDLDITNDNVLFNAVRDPNSSLTSTVEDWIESYQDGEDGPATALAEFINFVLRCCGCNASVDQHETMDHDAAHDRLEELQEDFKRVSLKAYPLVSKSKQLKKFKSSLEEFLNRLITSVAEAEILFDDVFCETIQSFLVAASSSKVRSFRHTSTVIVLTLVTAMCDIAVTVGKEFTTIGRQKETEAKKGRTDKARLKDLEKRLKQTHTKKTKLESYFTEIFDGVFVHRYRDADPGIRAFCIQELGLWTKKHPDYWLEGNYLRYIGWCLSDLDKNARHIAVKALAALYKHEEFIGTMHHFTERFRPRLSELATSEIDLTVRVAAIEVLCQVDKFGILDDQIRDNVGRLIFHVDPKSRKAAATFYTALHEEAVENERADLEIASPAKKKKKTDHTEQATKANQVQLHCLIALLVRHSQQLDRLEHRHTDVDEEATTPEAQAISLLPNTLNSRITLAVEALWDKVDIVRDWTAMLDYLLLDHSARDAAPDDDDEELPDPDATPKKTKPSGKANGTDSLEKALKLDETQESAMLEVFVASLARTRMQAESDKDQDAETVINDLTRPLMTHLPALFAKYQTDVHRIVTIIRIPQIMNLDMYLDMRITTAYEELWDLVTKQFFSHSHQSVLDACRQTLNSMLQTGVLSQTNEEKLDTLHEKATQSLRELTEGLDMETVDLDGDKIEILTAMLSRLSMLLLRESAKDCLEDTGGLKYTSALDIIDSISERGQLGDRNEEKLICGAIQVLFLYLMWKARQYSTNEDALDASRKAAASFRNRIAEKLAEMAIGRRTNATEEVKKLAFRRLLDIHLYAKATAPEQPETDGIDPSEDEEVKLVLDTEAQYRCAGFVQAEIERWADIVAESPEAADSEPEQDQESEQESESDQDKPAKNGKAKRNGKHKATKSKSAHSRTVAQMEAELMFDNIIATYIRAIDGGVIDISHSKTIFAHYDLFGGVFDQCCKHLTESLKAMVIGGDDVPAAISVMTESLEEATKLIIDGQVAGTDHLVGLSKLFGSVVTVRGAKLAVVFKLDSQSLVQLHNDTLDWSIKKMAEAEKTGQKSKRKTYICVFRALHFLLTAARGSDALKIHTHASNLLKQYDLDTKDPTIWKWWKEYEKRLISLMSKDQGIKAAARRKQKASSPAAGTTTGGDSDQSGVDEERQALPRKTKKTPVRAKPRPKAKAKPKAAEAEPSEDEEPPNQIDDPQDEDGDAPPPDADAPAQDDDEITSLAGSKRKREVTPSDDEDQEVEESLLANKSRSVSARASTVEQDEDEEEDGDERMRDVSPVESEASVQDKTAQKFKRLRAM